MSTIRLMGLWVFALAATANLVATLRAREKQPPVCSAEAVQAPPPTRPAEPRYFSMWWDDDDPPVTYCGLPIDVPFGLVCEMDCGVQSCPRCARVCHKRPGHWKERP